MRTCAHSAPSPDRMTPGQNWPLSQGKSEKGQGAPKARKRGPSSCRLTILLFPELRGRCSRPPPGWPCPLSPHTLDSRATASSHSEHLMPMRPPWDRGLPEVGRAPSCPPGTEHRPGRSQGRGGSSPGAFRSGGRAGGPRTRPWQGGCGNSPGSGRAPYRQHRAARQQLHEGDIL